MIRVLLAVTFVATLSGCAFLDEITGVNDNFADTDLNPATENIIDRAEDIGNGVIPGAGWLIGGGLSALAVGYRAARRRKKAVDDQAA